MEKIHIYFHSKLPGSAAHKSRTLAHSIEIAFNPDKVHIFPGKNGTHTIIPEVVSQEAETVQSVPHI